MSKPTGYVYEEVYCWHSPGSVSFDKWIEPGEHWENQDTKRRFHNLLSVSGVLDKLHRIKARPATIQELTSFHTLDYIKRLKELSDKDGGQAGEEAPFQKGAYEIALLSAGGVIKAVEEIISGKIQNAYCLVRPPGHHAESNRGRGFCLFNNIVLACEKAKQLGMKKWAIIDYDVHHGNGTEDAYINDPDVLFISIHQDGNYPVDRGGIETINNTTINIPLPAGSGHGAYVYAFETVVLPALHQFKPEFVLVSSGFDAEYNDPLANMMIYSETFRYMASSLVKIAEEYGKGRIVFSHEGGYSKDYVPFCGLAVIEAISGISSGIVDPYLREITSRSGNSCLPHQALVVNQVASILNLPCKGMVSLSPAQNSAYSQVRKLLEQVDKESRQKIIAHLQEMP